MVQCHEVFKAGMKCSTFVCHSKKESQVLFTPVQFMRHRRVWSPWCGSWSLHAASRSHDAERALQHVGSHVHFLMRLLPSHVHRVLSCIGKFGCNTICFERAWT